MRLARTRLCSLRTSAALAAVVLPCSIAVAADDAAASSKADAAIHARFAKLRSQLEHGRGLSKNARHHLLAVADRAERQQSARHDSCGALATLEDLRQAIRTSTAPHVAGVDGVEVAIVKTKTGRRCAFLTRRVTIIPEGFGAGPIKHPKRPRKTPEENRRGLLTAPTLGPPNAGPPTTVVPVSPGASQASGSSPFAFSAITSIATHVGLFPEEPSVAKAGQVVWYTGNSGAAFSLDGGATFTRVNPRDLFPEGVNAFCCDQTVVYAPQINRFIWIIQYWCAKPDAECNRHGSTNRERLLVASPQDIAANHGEIWHSWAIEPKDVRRRHDWFDYPAIGLGAHSLYVTFNLFNGGPWEGAVVGRVGLNELKAGAPLTLRYHVDPGGFSYKPVRVAGERGFLTMHDSDTRLLTLTWNEGSPLLLLHHTRHSVDASSNYGARAPDGIDWEGNTDDGITGATLRGNEVWLAWSEGRSICTARCKGDHPRLRRLWAQPHVHVVVLDARSLKLKSERFIHNSDYAIAYPSLATDSSGRIGMSFTYGGGSARNPSPAAGYLTRGGEFRQVATSLSGVEQGDFFSLSPDWPDGRHLIGSGYVADAIHTDGSADLRWLFFRYAR